jgi:glycosyltransferase involved in cell wall biosynthesis
MKLDMLAFEEHFVDHLAGVWHRLPAEARGDFIVPSRLAARVVTRGIEPTRDIVHEDRPVLVASYGDLKKARQLGRRRLAFIEHGIGQSYHGDPKSAGQASYSGGRDRDDIGLFLVPNEDAASRWRTAYPRASVAVVGSPKAEALPGLEGAHHAAPVVAISFHFPSTLCPEANSAWPEFRKALPAVAERFRVIGHGHPRAFGMLGLRTQYARVGITPVEDFAEVCRRADVYVCDNSSTIYEFASTGRPVVLMNASGYRRAVRHGLRFWDAAGVGVNVDAPGDLVAGIEEAIADAPERRKAREKALALVYQPREDVVAVLLEWMGSRAEVAA